MATSVNKRVQKHRESLRRSGLRPIQIWVPDRRAPGFADICRSQARAAARADAEDRDLAGFLDAALDEFAGGES